ncbi:MAG: copper resistance protein CopC/CopD [Acidimicrobiia bacterium]|nr:copper resistance protein CopC/CopD [Acidimicrobiia bacterium]
MSRPARLRVGLIAVVVALVAGLWPATSASAHALRISSVPDNGAVLKVPPTEVTVTFGEVPDPALSSLRVLDSSGAAHQQGRTSAVPGQPATLRVAVGHLDTGVYTVTWTTVSHVDGHLASGSFAFGVGVSPGNAGAATAAVVKSPPPSNGAVAARWLMYVGLMALFGLGVFRLIAVEQTPRRLKVLAAAAWIVGATGIAGITQWARTAAHLPLGHLLSSSLGHQLVLRGAPMAAAGLAVVIFVAVSGRRRWPAVLVAATAALVMWGDVATAHAAAAHSWRWFDEASQFVHFASAGLWAGGLAALVLTLGVLGRPERALAAKRFSTAAGVALLLIAASGAQRALSEVGAWGRFWSNTFGRWVLLKIVLFCILAALGAVNRYRNVDRADVSPRPLRRVSGVELFVIAIVLVATGFLQNLAPAASAAPPKPPPPVVAAGHDFGTTVRVSLAVSPGMAGFNQFTARIVDYDTAKPLVADTVSLHFVYPSRPDVGSSDLTLTRQRNGTYAGQGANLALDGMWNVTVLVARGVNSVEVPLQLTTRTPPQTVTLSRQPGLPTIYTIHLSAGRSVQVYLDPGKRGVLNEFHHTYLAADGSELNIDQVAVAATPPGQSTATTLTTRKLDPFGHYVSDLPPGPSGRYHFTMDATTVDGAQLTAHLDIVVS